MRTVGCNEIDQGFWMFQVLHHVSPTAVGLDPGVTGLGIKIATRRVKRWDPGVAAARNVEHGKVERRAEQIIAQGFGDKLINLIAHRSRDAANNCAGCLLRGRTAGSKGQRIEESRNETKLVVRSEEHTSELQSRRDLVCRLLLEKKKK